MKANIEVICYKYKPLKDGTLPLMLRVTKDRKRKYVSLGLSLHEKFWDFEKSKPKRTSILLSEIVPTRSKSNG